MPYLQRGNTLRLLNGDIVCIDRLIGTGAMSEVYLCFSAQQRRKLALKFMFGKYSSSNVLYYRKCRLLSSHPAPVPELAWFLKDGITAFDGGSGSFAYLMPYLEGYEDLVAPIRDPALLDTARRRAVCSQLALLLSELHRAGYVYGDISAKNVMYRAERSGGVRVKLIDCDNITLPGHALGLSGTGLYRAPELLLGSAPTPESDRHALAVLAFRLLLGRHPLDTAEARSHSFTPENVREYFGRQPRFLFDDTSGGVSPALAARWNSLSHPLQLYFRYMFSQDCLTQPQHRPDCLLLHKALNF